ncbi:MAG: Membrane dipeptidase (Peptidase family M19) [Firmicutes bacterium ADurb.Bin248]|nr:MAG: Membrane dipeptidase (Peptidase family M19) [Firmicutes bacterium ADurb.Bin248]HOG00183.1 dipeptidase [Clostridia bacterium]
MEKMRFIDLHCDTVVCEVMKSGGKKHLRANPGGDLDLLRLQKAGSLVQAFALFISKEPAKHGYVQTDLGPWEFYLRAAELYERELAGNADLLAPVLKYEDVAKNASAGKIGALLTIEDGAPLEGDLARLEQMHRRGVRLITLTWNHENSLGFPNAVDPEKGLKPFGFAALERMNGLGVIPDVSHLSDAGFWDVAGHTKKPFVASHSNARALCPSMRNLTDAMLRALAEKGGVAGLNFAADFLVENGRLTTIRDIVRHARHIADVAGAETVALGSDFDGIGCAFEFGDCAGLPLIEEALNKAFPAREVDLITHGNALRVLRESLG